MPEEQVPRLKLWLIQHLPGLSYLIPDYVVSRVTEIDQAMLEGIKVALIDWGGTLAVSLRQLPCPESRKWLANLCHNDDSPIQIVIVSDYLWPWDRGSLESFCSRLEYQCQLGHLLRHLKLLGRPQRAALSQFCQGVKPEEILVIGNCRIRDILSARLFLPQARTVYVSKPLPNSSRLLRARKFFFRLIKSCFFGPLRSSQSQN